MNLLIKFPPVIAVPLLFFFVGFGLVARFFLGTLVGGLFVSLFLYWAFAAWGVEVLTGGQVVLWIDGLGPEYKAALLTSLVTVAGFIVAFHSATANWRNQLNAELKAKVAGELEEFFGPLSASIGEASIYANQLVDAVNKIQNGISFTEASFSVKYLQEQQSRFLTARNHIVQSSSEIHRLIGRSYNVLSSGWGAMSQMQATASALSDISGAIWIPLPVVDPNDPDHVQAFVNQVNVTQCLDLMKVCSVSSTKISGLVGGIRGQLLAPIVGFNLAALLDLLSNGKDFWQTVSDFHHTINNKRRE